MTGKSFFRFALVNLLLLSTVSCSLMRGTRWKATHPLHNVQKLTHPTIGREVIFVPMQHMSSDEDYAETHRYLDSLKAKGYVTFFEGVVYAPFHIDTTREINVVKLVADLENGTAPADSMRMDTLLRKCRRVLGCWVGEGGYADPKNASLKGSAEKRSRYVPQTNEALGLCTESDIWADYSLADLVEIYEKKYGKIELTDYDFETGLYEKYNPEQRIPPRTRDYLILFARNDLIVRKVSESRHPKIAVVYGSAHSFGVTYFLKKDHGFRIDRRYKAQNDYR